MFGVGRDLCGSSSPTPHVLNSFYAYVFVQFDFTSWEEQPGWMRSGLQMWAALRVRLPQLILRLLQYGEMFAAKD